MATSDVSNDTTHKSETFWVSPLKPVKAETIALPAADQIGVTIIQPLVVCFTTNEDFDEAAFIEAIKVATAGVAWEIPALAGSVEWEDQARRRIKCVIPEDPKVRVTIKHIPEYDGAELDATHWPVRQMVPKLICFTERTQYGVGTFNFGIQANIIKGGVLLTMHMNHIILDGGAQAMLECVFGLHLGRAMAGKAPKLSGIIPPEALDKSMAYGSHPARPMLEWKDWKEAPKHNLTIQQIGALIRQKMTLLAITTWYLTPEKAQKLRAAMQQPGKPKLSMATCMAIFMWRAVTRARELDADEETTFFMPVQTRGRVQELHPSYIGSALVYARTKVTVKELQTLSFAELGQRIEKSVAWWTPERIREFWGSIEDADNLANYTPNQNRDFGPDVEFTNISNMPFYTIPWGKGLEVKSFRVTSTPFSDGWGAVMPRFPDGGQEFNIFLQKEQLPALFSDPEFREYADYWAASDKALDAVEAENRPAAKAKL